MRTKKTYSYEAEHDVHRITLYNTVYPEHCHTSRKHRLYGHFDFACFYAQCEQLKRNLYGFPLIVGGWRKSNGVVKGIVATASYEAREHGIDTGMSALEAFNLCPFVIMLQVDYDRYTAISKQVSQIFSEFSDEVERYSMDEFFLNLSFLRTYSRKATREYVNRLQREIYRSTGLVGALGVSYSKTYAKLASGLHKPRGISLILNEEDARRYIYPLPVDEVWGIGRRRAETLASHGFHKIKDVVKGDEKTLQRLFGPNFGKMMYWNITGKEQARILTEHDTYVPKHGVGYGHTFSEGSQDLDRIRGEFAIAVQQLCYRMRGYGFRSSSFAGYFGFNNPDEGGVPFRFVTDAYTNVDDVVFSECMRVVEPMLKSVVAHKEVRNIVLGTHNIDKSSQLNLFAREEPRLRSKFAAVDQIKNRFGHQYIQSAGAMHRVQGQTHFVERS